MNNHQMIDKFRMQVLVKGLELEMIGMKRHGKTCFQIIKDEFGITGRTRKEVLNKFKEYIKGVS
jgi:hypothetical protein